MILKIPQYQHVFLLLLASFFTTFAKISEANTNFRDQFLESTINKEPCQTYDQSIYWQEWETQLKNKNIQVENGKITKSQKTNNLPGLKKAKNVILLIGDGMGISTVTAARTYGGQKYSKKLENTCAGDYKLTMDQIFDNTALSKTYCLNTHTPDSSSTATAMYTGHKTKNQQIGHPEQGLYVNIRDGQEKIPNIAQIAKKNGKSVGFITNTHMFHATPASLYANQTDRWNKEKTMKSFAEATIGENKYIDLAIGGGKKYFEGWPKLTHPKTEESIEFADLGDFYHLPELEELKMESSNTNSSNFFKNLWKNNKPILKPIWKKHRPWWVDLSENNQNQEWPLGCIFLRSRKSTKTAPRRPKVAPRQSITIAKLLAGGEPRTLNFFEHAASLERLRIAEFFFEILHKLYALYVFKVFFKIIKMLTRSVITCFDFY